MGDLTFNMAILALASILQPGRATRVMEFTLNHRVLAAVNDSYLALEAR